MTTHRAHRLQAPFPMREAVVHVGRMLAQRQLIAGQDGNVSVRVSADRILVTPAGFAKGALGPDDLVEVSPTGEQLSGRHGPTSELGLHLAAYAARIDVNAVVHAHPPTATAFSIVGETIPDGVLAELMLTVGTVGLAPYVRPGTAEVGTVLTPMFRDHDVILLAHHGAVAVGRSLQDAHFAMESLEHGARVIHLARQLGNVVTLDSAACGALRAARGGARNDAAHAALMESEND
ncbi:MAG TPA: class II aldolase/adducin family protein [Gemmatimonadaceae bacterium]|nr:class II aldolase/adducin family protein [Gemmatimonadaceae bacterium]